MQLQSFLFILVFLASLAAGATELHDAPALRERFRLQPYLNDSAIAARLKGFRIAVLDTGFQGFDAASGDLPAGTELVEKYPGTSEGNPLASHPHGLYLAQAIWALTGRDAAGPKLFLLNANGLTNLRHAVDYAIGHAIDIILYSQNWEYGGNFDGKGFLNGVVNKATERGILWINAAGNYGGSVYNGAVKALPDCLRIGNAYDRNRVAITVSWNDFREVEEYQSGKDLDAFLYDGAGNLVAKSDRAQKTGPADKSAEDAATGVARVPSLHAREKIEGELARGDYCLKLKDMSGNFAATDTVRVTVASLNKPEDSLQLFDRTPGQEIMIPADNPNVLTVGDLSASAASGPTVDGRMKPEITLDASEAKFSDGFVSSGTSNAAAYFAAIAAVLKAADPGMNRATLLEKARQGVISRVGPRIFSALARYGAIGWQEIAGARAGTDQPTLYLRKDPSAIPVLFENASRYLSETGLPSTNLRYFIAPAGSQVQTYCLLNPQGALPAGARWVELRGSAPRGWGLPWRTPAPADLR